MSANRTIFIPQSEQAMAFEDEQIHEEDLSADIGDSNQGSPEGDPKKPAGRRLLFRLITNKYLLTILAFLVWLVFFDSNNLIFRHRVKSEIRQMEIQKEYYQQEIKQNHALRELLTHDLDAVEAFGREKYLMKRPDEEIYLIVEDQ